MNIFAANIGRQSNLRVHGLVLMMVGFATLWSPPAASETHVIEIRDFLFTPDALNITVGDTVTWVNLDVVPHTATAVDGSWDSGSLEQGDEWSLVIETVGVIDYLCTFHPQMVGVLNVE